MFATTFPVDDHRSIRIAFADGTNRVVVNPFVQVQYSQLKGLKLPRTMINGDMTSNPMVMTSTA